MVVAQKKSDTSPARGGEAADKSEHPLRRFLPGPVGGPSKRGPGPSPAGATV